MERFIVQGGVPISGTVTVSGNKNAALKLIAACILTDEPVILHNVPDIADVRTMLKILNHLGVTTEKTGESSWHIHAKEITTRSVDPAMASNIRASIVLAGPMLARCGEIELPPPGGDIIGRRRV